MFFFCFQLIFNTFKDRDMAIYEVRFEISTQNQLDWQSSLPNYLFLSSLIFARSMIEMQFPCGSLSNK
jgi:hypothetical protein